MEFVNAKCTNCGATLEIDKSKDAFICKYCGNAIITEKAIANQSSFINNVNINSSGNTITIINNENKDENRFPHSYTLSIIRPKKFIGSAAQWLFDIDGVLYPINNGERIDIKTNLKRLNSTIIMKFADGEQRRFRFTLISNGDNIEISVVPTLMQSIKISESTCKSATIIKI